MTSTSIRLLCALALVSTSALADPVAEEHRGGRYEVRITNLTRGQQFTPVLLATHKAGATLFEVGKPASTGLSILAEEGNTAPLAAELVANSSTGQVVTGSGLTNPGATTTLIVERRGPFSHFSLAAMLIPTNDAFVAVNGAALPRGNDVLVLRVPVYDAGSERNDELCVSIPGPFFVECGGSGGGGAPSGDEEGFVHIHSGIHGIGDLKAALRDWRNPVAQITVRRLP